MFVTAQNKYILLVVQHTHTGELSLTTVCECDKSKTPTHIFLCGVLLWYYPTEHVIWDLILYKAYLHVMLWYYGVVIL